MAVTPAPPPPPRSEGRSGPAPRSEGRAAQGRSGPGPNWRDWPTSLRTSVAFGVVGAVLLIAGIVSGATAVLVAATVAGSLSLIFALVWRGQLIEAWRREKGRPGRQW